MTQLTFYRVLLEMTEQGGVTIPGPAIRDEPDALLDLDALGFPHIPGTSLAGALRERVRQLGDEDQARAIFGHVDGPGQRDDGTIQADASRLWVMNADLASGEAPDEGDWSHEQIVTRWSTAIDRRRGAARVHTLRGVQMLPIGTRFVARLWLEEATEEAQSVIQRALTGWAPLIGRAVSSGHGRLAVVDIRSATLNLRMREDLVLWLRGGGPALVDAVTLDEARCRTLDLGPIGAQGTAGQPHVLRTKILAPLFVGDKKSESGGKKTTGKDGGQVQITLMRAGQPLVPGSSIKGVLRSRCEFILNTVGITACPEQMCGHCPTCAWFGHGGGDHDFAASVGARSKVRIADATITGAKLRTRAHVALDRWTGGVSQDTPNDDSIHPPGQRGGKLYSYKAVERGNFEITLGLSDLTVNDDRDLFLATIALVVEDINAGLVAFGAATTRGYGTVEIEETDWLPTIVKARATLKARAQGGARP